jgi:hypothetical protein
MYIPEMDHDILLIHGTDVPIVVLRRRLKGKGPKAGFVEFRAAATSPYRLPGISPVLEKQAPIHVSPIF